MPDRLGGRSRYSSLPSSGGPSGFSVAGQGPAANTLKGPVQVRESSLGGGFIVNTLLLSFPGNGGGIVDLNLSTVYIYLEL